MIPDIRYAKTPEGVHIAYQVVGDGPMDLVWPGPGYSSMHHMWRLPKMERFLNRLGSIARLIAFDPRGLGLSDPISASDAPTLESRMEDTLSVMEAAGSERAALLGFDATGPLAVLFAATHPDRTAALIVYASYARGSRAPDYPWAQTDQQWDEYMLDLERRWGQPEYVREYWQWLAPTALLDEAGLEAVTSVYRTVSPGTALALEAMERDTDIRKVLPAVQIPTLVLHRTDDQVYSLEEARYLAEHIPGARFVELEGRDHLAWEGDSEALVSAIDRFLRSVRDEESEFDRVLATVLFTDIVDSTAQSAAIGDRAWTETRAQHDRIVRANLARFRGREIKTMGDGFLAMFDGPARGVRCAEAIANAVRALGIEIRAGVHTGEVAIEGDDVAGLGVAIGARVGAKRGRFDEVLVSSDRASDLVAGSAASSFEDAGEHELKGVPDRWRLFRVVA